MLLVKKELHDRYMTQADLVRLTGLDKSTVSRIVNGRSRPYPVQAKRIALALSYEGDVEELFGEVYDG